MRHDEWVKAGRPHWQCQSCKGIMVTVAIADDFVCDLCKRPWLRKGFKAATEEDFAKWLLGNHSLLDYCVCSRYPKSCRFHTDRTITEGPHNLLPDIEPHVPLNLYYFYGNESDRITITKMNELTKARLYKILYDDGMRIDRAVWIIKEAK